MLSLFRNRKSKEELANEPLDKKGRKEGRLLLKGVRKFLRYNDDLLSDSQREAIDEHRSEFATALEDTEKPRKELEELAGKLTDTCKKSVKSYRPSAMKDNIEVIFVAIVIAMGIRAYFIQQFKIPTGSMQPTLNGIIAYPDPAINPDTIYQAPEDYERPGLVRRTWDKVWFGRSHVEWIAKEDDYLIFDSEHFYGKTHFIFFPRTYLKTKNGHVYGAPGTESRVASLFNFTADNFVPPGLTDDQRRLRQKGLIPIKKGQVIARGYVDTGDQLVVDKFTYHWRKPKRGEVFVFDTRNIDKIQRNLIMEEIMAGISPRGAREPRQGSQHYIKRLVGVPGDNLEIRSPELWVNGEPAKESGIERVASQEGYYTGYLRQGTSEVSLPDRKYWAMGDNSANSSDSRDWGFVHQENIVGRAAFVYYPFGHHFGPID